MRHSLSLRTDTRLTAHCAGSGIPVLMAYRDMKIADLLIAEYTEFYHTSVIKKYDI